MDFQHLRSIDSLPSNSGFSYLNLEPRRRVEEQDLLSRFEECSRKNKDLNVDCTLQLGLHSNSKPTSTNDHTHGSLQGYNIPDGRWKTVPVIHTNGALAYTGGGSSSMASSSSSSVYPEYKMYPAFYHFQNTIATTINQHKTPEITGRKCAICLTTSTPLWRNGPGGSKTLCNACGIRYKKEEKRVRLAESRDNRMKMG